MTFLKGLLDWIIGIISGIILFLIFVELCELEVFPSEVVAVKDNIFQVAQFIVGGVKTIVDNIIAFFTSVAV